MSSGAHSKGSLTMIKGVSDLENRIVGGDAWTRQIGNTSGNKAEFKYSTDTGKRNQTRSVAHPIHSLVTIYDKPIGTWWQDKPVEDWDQIWYSSHGVNYKDPSTKLVDEIATNCSLPGSNPGHIDQSNINCWTYDNSMSNPNRDDGVVTRTNWDTYCQMGDNIFRDSNCSNIKSTYSDDTKPTEKAYDFSMERICNKRKGIDNISKDTPVTTNYILDPRCQEWCGNLDKDESGNFKNDCSIGGNFYCGNPNNWPEAVESCKNDIWGKQFDKDSAENSCGNLLIDGLSDQNIFTDNGCGKLCQSNGVPDNSHKDVNHTWCKDKYGEYCGKDKFNMFSNDCHDFCELNPEKCEISLTNMCSPINTIGRNLSPSQPLTDEEFHLIQAKMDQYIPGTTHKWSDWCGCYQGKQFYDKWREIEYAKWRAKGIDPEIALPRIEEECTYPWCKPSIKTFNQSSTECPMCTQLRFDDWSNALVNLDKSSIINTGQELNCGQVAQDILNQTKDDEGNVDDEKKLNERETSELKGKNPIDIEWIPDNFDLSTKEGQLNVGIIVAIIVGSLLVIGLVGRLIYVKISGKFRLKLPKNETKPSNPTQVK